MVGRSAAAVVAFAAGATAAAAAALLLHPGPGALASTGFVAAVYLVALAAGVWAAAPRSANGPEPPVAPATSRRNRLPWYVATAAYAAGAVFLTVVADGAIISPTPAVRSLAVLLLLVAPGYSTGWLLGALGARDRDAEEGHGPVGVAVPALAGAGAGVLVAAAVLIPRADPNLLFLSAAAVVAAAGWSDTHMAPFGAARRRGMRDRVVLVTGVGGRGQMGYALAEAFLAAGARVLITGRSPEVERHAAELAALGEVRAVQADLTDPAQADAVVAAARDRFGRLDALVNAVGGLSVVKPIAETSLEEWRRELDRNAATTFLICRAALPLLRESRGAIVNFASPAGVRAAPGVGAYSAAKSAVVAMSRALALEERDNGVRVNVILPGMIDTEQNRREVANPESVRWVTREQIARVALFLAGDDSSGITGEAIHVPGAGVK